MARLILSMDGLVLKDIPLDKPRLTIGRKAHNDIQIDSLAISGNHAEVVTILGDSFLEDLDSTNGTLVNGQPIKKTVLRHNDVVEIGKYRLKFMVDEVSENQTGGLNQPSGIALTPETRRIDSNTQTAMAHPPPAQEPTLARVTVRLLSGPSAGKALELVKPNTTLGRPGVQVAVIARRAEGVFVTHVEGANYPAVNGAQVGGEAYPLKDKDLLELADIRMEISIKP